MVWLFLALQVADLATTYIGLRLGASEHNPVFAWLLVAGGWPLAASVKLGISGMILASLAKRRRIFQVGCVALMAIVVANNIAVIAILWYYL